MAEAAPAAPGQLAFDAQWYLQSNPDVAAAGIDPWQHYLQAGRAEGRLGAPVRALLLDRRMWAQGGAEARAALEALADAPLPGAGTGHAEAGQAEAGHAEAAIEQACAGWALARWHASEGDWAAAARRIALFHLHPLARRALAGPGPFLLAAEAAARTDGSPAVAAAWKERLLAACGAGPDPGLLDILRARLLPGADGDAALSRALARLYEAQSLAPVRLAPGGGSRFARLQAAREGPWLRPDSSMPLVSVIMAAHEAEASLGQAIAGVLAQDWTALELIVVDDGSRDGTLAAAQAAAAGDARVRVLRSGQNRGAFAARNLGLAAARGAFLTAHDADDWSHPAKLRLQLLPLVRDPSLMATVSHWLRAGADLAMARWRIEPEGWVHRNASSLMMRAEVREVLGFWDDVRFNADTEFYYRLAAAYGPGAIAEVLPGVPLSWGRVSERALTSRPESHVRSHLWGLRDDYLTAARYWHGQAAGPADLHLPRRPRARRFPAPAVMAPAAPPPPPSDFTRLVESPWFDAAWYLSAYRDVERSGRPAALHYLESGAPEDRDPGPEFSASGWRAAAGVPAGEAALFHWLDAQPQPAAPAGQGDAAAGRPAGGAQDARQDGPEKGPDDGPEKGPDGGPRDGRPAPVVPRFAGRLAARRRAGPFGQRVLVCAHAAGGRLFGAERSFLQMLRRLKRRGRVPVVVVPAAGDADYLAELRRLSAAVAVVPMAWRQGGRGPDPRTVEILRGLIREFDVREVHVNTVVLDAPLAAARAEGRPSVVHVRELPEGDPPLCRALEMTPGSLRTELLQQADSFVANGPPAAAWLGCPARTRVAPNRAAWPLFRLPWAPGRVLRAGLISSNLAKKGIADAAAAAALLAARGAPVEVLLIGPRTADLEALGPLPDNLRAPGYAASPAAALAQVDVVLSLSHFAESFGRTVLEALAAGRPVVCYGRGMPPHLTGGDGACGRVVAADDIAAVAGALAGMAADRAGLAAMSRRARRRALRLNLGG